jgi:hypothetical protein
MLFPMWSMEPFLTPMATKYDPNAATANMLHARGMEYQNEQAKQQLAEQKRHSTVEEGIQGFNAFGNQFNQNREYDERARARKEGLLKWVMGLAEDDEEKFAIMAPLVDPILKQEGISITPPGMRPEDKGQGSVPMQPQKSEGEQQIANIAAIDAGTETPTAGSATPPQSGAADQRAAVAREQQLSATRRGRDLDPGIVMQDPNWGRNIDPGITMPDPNGGKNLDPGIEMTDVPGSPTPPESGALPGESLGAYFNRELAPTLPKKAAPGAETAAPEVPEGTPENPFPGASRAWTFSIDGKPAGSLDLERLRSLKQQRTGALAEGFQAGAMPAADVPFIKGMMSALTEMGLNTDKAAAFIKNVVQPELDRRSKERSSYALARAKGQSGTGQERFDLSLYEAGQKAAREPLEKYPKIKDDLGAYSKMKTALDLFEKGDSGVDSAVAYRTLALMLNSGALSDKDAVAPEQFASWSTKAMRFLSTGVAGDLTDAEKEDLQATLRHKIALVESQAKEVYDSLIESANGSTMYDQPRYRQGYANELKFYRQFPFYDQKEVDSVLRGTPPVPSGGGGGGGRASTTTKGSPVAPEMSKPPSETARKLLEKGP